MAATIAPLLALLFPIAGPAAPDPPADKPVATVTAVHDGTVYLMATDDIGLLMPGTALRVVRAGQTIATIVVGAGEPVHADAPSLPDERLIAIGDKCYAVSPGQTPTRPEEAPPGPSPPPEQRQTAGPARSQPSGSPIAATVTAIEDSVIYLNPTDGDRLVAGTRLVVDADGESVALLVVRSAEPHSADLVGIRPGITLQIGQECRLATTDIELPAPPAAQPPEPPKYSPPRRTVRVPDRRVAPPLGPSILGPTGIIRMPSAEVQPHGRGAFAITSVPGDLDKRVPGNRDQEQFVLGLFPRVEAGSTMAEYFGGYDITAHGKIQLVKEGNGFPAIAVGAAELGRNEHVGGSQSNVLFGAASRHFLDDRLRVTLGYASRGLEGIYGGAEYGPDPHITLLGEYDTRRFNWGVRISPTSRTQVAAALGENGWDFQFGYNWAAMSQSRAPAPDVNIARPPESPADWQPLVEGLQKAIVNLGLENVRVSVRDDAPTHTAVVEYENRRYSHNEVEALGRVLALSVAALPQTVARLHVVINKLDVAIATCAIDADEYTAFMSGQLTSGQFSRHVRLMNGPSPMRGALVASTNKASYSRGRVDLTLHPDLRTRIGTEDVHVATGWALEPELTTSAAPGLALTVRSHFPVAGPLRSQTTNQPFDLATAAQTFWLADNLLARGHVGRFPGRLDGFYGEALYLPPSGRHLLGLSGGSLRHRFGGSITGWDTTIIGQYRYSIPQHNVFLGMHAGRYLHGDWGAAATIRQDLGDTVLTAELAKSELGTRGALWIDIPFGSGVDAKPSTLRPRLPGYLEHGLLVGAGDTEEIDIVELVLREADIGGTLVEDMLNRNRLSSAYVRTHLQDLKRAGGRAVGGALPHPASPATD